MKKMTCSKCGDEFDLLPGKPGFANVCPKCSVQSPEERERKVAEEERKHKLYAASVRSNSRHGEEERKHDLALKLNRTFPQATRTG
jgi:hypothetical protein